MEIWGEAGLFSGIWGAKTNTFREPRQLFSGIWGDQCIIFRDQGSTDPPPPPGGPHYMMRQLYYKVDASYNKVDASYNKVDTSYNKVDTSSDSFGVPYQHMRIWYFDEGSGKPEQTCRVTIVFAPHMNVTRIAI